jgi:hypothetical protein
MSLSRKGNDLFFSGFHSSSLTALFYPYFFLVQKWKTAN